jgi:hypothetical protein
MARVDEKKLKAGLAERGYESVSIKPGTHHKLLVDANKLHPVEDGEGDELYVSIPVSFSVEVTDNGDIRSLEDAEPSPAAIADAQSFVRGLEQRSEIEAAPGSASEKATHRTEKDAHGRRILRRIQIAGGRKRRQ